MKFLQRPPAALLAIVVVVGFLLVVTGTATSAQHRSSEPRRRAIVDQILEEKQGVAKLDDQIAEENKKLSAANKRVAAISSEKSSEQGALDLLGLQAGTVGVKGSGVEVVVADAPRKADQSVAFDASRVQDNDLQLVVNALFASGAEAIAINDNRIVAVTPIRAAGGTIVVNFRPVNSPYRIVAIGADREKFAQSDIAKHFALWKKKYDLGFNVNSRRGLVAPAYSGRVGIDIARTDAYSQTQPTSGQNSTSSSLSRPSVPLTSTTQRRVTSSTAPVTPSGFPEGADN